MTTLEIETVEMHTGGQSTRIVVAGYPDLSGTTLLEKRLEARAQHDHIRRLLMHEPRGHKQMYGAVVVPADRPEADLAVLFLHNQGYSTMCGHAVLALGRYAVDRGLVAKGAEETLVRIQCPCGLVPVTVEADGSARFSSVPSFALALNRKVETESWGRIGLDIGYGGAFYAILPAKRLGLDLSATPVAILVAAAAAVSEATAAQSEIRHPQEPDLGFLYGTILTDGGLGLEGNSSRNLCVFAGDQVDRSPTGSGVTARLAIMRARSQTVAGQEHLFDSIAGSRFQARVMQDLELCGTPAVTVEVKGKAHYSGHAHFTLEPDDPFPDGFLL